MSEKDMKVQYSFNEKFNHLFPIHNIKIRTKLLKEYNEADTNGKIDLIHNSVLNNSYLRRRVLDPGLYGYVIDQLLSDIRFPRMVEVFIDRELFTDFDYYYFSLYGESKSKKTLNISVSDDVHTGTSGETEVEVYQEINEKAIQFFNDKLQMTSNLIEKHALQNIQREYESGMFIPASAYQDVSNSTTIPSTANDFINPVNDLEGTQFLIRNLDYYENYQGGSLFSKSEFLHFCQAGPVEMKYQIINVIKARIEKEMGHVDKANKHYLERLLSMFSQPNMLIGRLISHIISILSYSWFFEQEIKYKLSILNALYEFHLSKESIIQAYKIMKNHDGKKFADISFLSIASSLYQHGLFDESKLIDETVAELTESSTLQRVFYSNLATAYREMGEFGNALSYYKKSYELLEAKRDRGNSRALCVELKNIGESYLHLDDGKTASEYFRKVEKKIVSLRKKFDKCNILWNLANACRRCGYFEEEYTYLDEMIKRNILTDEFEMRVMARLTILTMAVNTDGMLNNEAIAKIELDQQYKQKQQVVSFFFEAFQFQRLIQYCNSSLIKNDMLEQSEFHKLGLSYFHVGKYDECSVIIAKSLIEKSIDPHGLVLSGISDLLTQDNNIGCQGLALALTITRIPMMSPEMMVQQMFILLIRKQNELPLELYSLLSRVVGKLPEKFPKSEAYGIFGYVLMDLGLWEEAIDCFKTGLSIDAKDAGLYNNFGTLYAKLGKTDDAMMNYNLAIEHDPTLPDPYYNIANTHAIFNDFDLSLKFLSKAIELAPENQLYSRMKSRWGELRNEYFNYVNLPDKKVKDFIMSGENYLNNMPTKGINYQDFSLALTAYGKAAESMLDIRLSIPFHDQTIATYGEKIDNKYWKGHKKEIPPLHGKLRKIFFKPKVQSIGLGEWAWIFNDVANNSFQSEGFNSPNPITSSFEQYIKKRFSLTEIRSMGKLCKEMSIYRNGSSHTEAKTQDDVFAIRKLVVSTMNDLIQLIYYQQ